MDRSSRESPGSEAAVRTEDDFYMRQLRAFVAVADHGSLSAGAQALNLSQPALSRLVARLEERLGVRLFERGRTGSTLTATGAALLPAARAVMESIRAFTETAQSVAAGHAGVLCVGTTEGATSLTTETLRRFRRSHPAVEIKLQQGHTPAKLAALRAGRLDFAFLRNPGQAAGVGMQEVITEPLVALVAVDHPLAGRSNVSLSDLVEYPLLLTPRKVNPGVHDAVLALFAPEQPQPHRTKPLMNEADGLAIVATSDAWMLLSRSASRTINGPIRCLDLPDDAGQVAVTVAWRLSGQHPAADHFRRAAAEAGAVLRHRRW